MSLNQLKSWQRWSALPIAIAILGVSFGATTLNQPTPVSAQMTTQGTLMKTLTVAGRGIERIQTTLAQVNLGVEVQAKTAQEAQQEAARRSSAVVELLKKRNVEKLETTGIRLNPIYSYSNNVQRLTGYSAVNTVSFRVPADRAGGIMDEAVNVGATRIDGISFIATDEAIATAQNSALRRATQDAQAQADAVLSTLGLTRKEVVSIQINGANTPPPAPIMFRSGANQAAAEAMPTPVIAGEQEVQASITLQIRY